MKEYWFARRFPIGSARNAMAPVHWKGWVVSLLFVLLLTIAGACLWWFAAHGEIFHGAAIFAVLAIVGGGWFVLTSTAKGDHVHTVQDYRNGINRV